MPGQWSPWFAWAMDLLKSVITLGLTVFRSTSPGSEVERTWVFRTMTLTCIHTTFSPTLYESAFNSKASESTKRQ